MHASLSNLTFLMIFVIFLSVMNCSPDRHRRGPPQDREAHSDGREHDHDEAAADRSPRLGEGAQAQGRITMLGRFWLFGIRNHNSKRNWFLTLRIWFRSNTESIPKSGNWPGATHKVSYFDILPGGTYPKTVWDRWDTSVYFEEILRLWFNFFC